MGTPLQSTLPCPKCNSSDAATLYLGADDRQYLKCYSCGKVTQMDDDDTGPKESVFERVKKRPKTDSPVLSSPTELGKVLAIPERDISRESAQFYGILQTDSEYRFPYVGGFKVRKKDDKKFFSEGKPTGLFGQDRFPAGGKFVTITEGEFDAVAAFQMLGARYPSVSIKDGASGAVKAVTEAFEWLDSFDKVVICFDNDKPGQEAAKKVAELFSHKALVVKLNKYKDANEYLSNQNSKDFVDSWWRAERYTPDGIVQGSTLWDKLNQPRKPAEVMYPFEGLNKLTYGIRKGELVMVTSGSGMGKSQFLRELTWQILQKTEDSVGLMFLEENNEKTGLGLMSLAVNKPLHLPDSEYTPEEYKDAFDKTLGTGRIYLFDHFGSSGIDNIVSRVRYMARGCNCGFILLDHISIVVSNQENTDERKALDEIMTKLRTLVQETGIALICVSHLKRPDGKGHEEGAATSLAQLRGSGSIAQLSDIVIGLERNGQADDPVERNTTYMRVLKNRFCGLTGPACAALYSRDTGRMFEVMEQAL